MDFGTDRGLRGQLIQFLPFPGGKTEALPGWKDLPQIRWLMAEWGIPAQGPPLGSAYTSPDMFLEKKDGSHRPGLGLPTLCLSSFCSWNGWLGLFVRVALIYNPQPGISSSSSNDKAFLAFVYQASNKHLEGKEKQKPCFLKNIRGNIPRKTLVFKSAPLDYLQEIKSKCPPPPKKKV